MPMGGGMPMGGNIFYKTYYISLLNKNERSWILKHNFVMMVQNKNLLLRFENLIIIFQDFCEDLLWQKDDNIQFKIVYFMPGIN
jgi:hypothetical protein